ncbi:MAG: translocation/assembly module TamB [Bacteroidales bacterium]|nr:translocation/assembly module TamB [Bacteroidales bacterium]HPE86113.1 translocation/assembly module TamB domain-containing protein [Bacteroidales bacterium]
MQSKLASFSASYLSQRFNTHITIERIAISPGLALKVQGFNFQDINDNAIAAVKKLEVKRLHFSRKKRHIQIGAITADSLLFNVHIFPDDSSSNLEKFLLQFSDTDTTGVTQPGKAWSIGIDRVSLAGAHVENRNFNKIPIPAGIDWNHTVLSGVTGEIKNVLVTDSLITANIKHLEFREISGLTVSACSGDFTLSSSEISVDEVKIKTAHSDLDFDFALLFETLLDFQYFIDSVPIQGEFRLSRLALDDLVFFVPDLQGIKDFIWIQGDISGPVSNLNGKNLELIAGTHTRLLTDFSILGLPYIDQTRFTFQIDELFTTPTDISGFSLPATEGAFYLSLPEVLDSLQYVVLTGSFTGTLTDFISKATLKTNLGTASANIRLHQNSLTNKLEYKGRIKGKGINAGVILQQQNLLDRFNLTMEIDGKGIDPATMQVSLTGSIDSLGFMDNKFTEITINSKFIENTANGTISIRDELGCVEIGGNVDLQRETPYANLTVDIKDMDLFGLHLTDSNHMAKVSTTLYAQTNGFHPDKMNGKLSALNTTYTEKHDTLYIQEFTLEQVSTKAGAYYNKEVTLNSDFLALFAAGNIPYQDFPAFITCYIQRLTPHLSSDSTTKISIRDNGDQFVTRIKIQEIDPLARIFFPALRIAAGTSLTVFFNNEEKRMESTLQAREMIAGGVTVNNLDIIANIDTLQGNLTVRSDEIILMEASAQDSLPLSIQNFMISGLAANDSIRVRLDYDDFVKKDHTKGYITAYASFSDYPTLVFGITENNLRINDTIWNFHKKNKITIEPERYKFQNVGFASSSQGIRLNGTVSKQPTDTLQIAFAQLDLTLLDLFLPKEIRIRGLMNGEADLTGIFDTPNFISDLTIDQFMVNGEELGNLCANTSWNMTQNHLDVNADLIYTGNIGSDTTLFIHGYYAPSRKGYFDFNIGAKNFNVEIARPWLEGVAENISGRMSGKLRLSGTPFEPVVTGKVFFMRTGFKIDYTQVDYTMADEIHFEKNAITFRDFTIYDPRGNRLIVNGGLKHQYFDDFEMDMNLDFQEIQVLKTTSMDNSSFYGRIFSSGDLSIQGGLDNLFITANVNTNTGTDVFVPVTYSISVGANDFITFVNPYDTLTKTVIAVPPPSGSGINIETRIQVDPNTKMKIFLPDNMGNMDVRGYGDIRFLMDDEYNYEIFGDYEIEGGSLLFTLQNVIRRSFNIRQGGRIKLTGDPMDAELNVEAIYHLRAGLNGLPTADTSMSSRRIPVDCVLGLCGPVSNPIIDFKIEMPDVDEQTRELIYSTIDTSNNTLMTQQMLSLLVLNSFSFSSPNTALTSGLGATSFDILTNQLSNWLSQISKDFDIGINYRPGDEITQEEMEVALRTQLFNDRVIIDGNIGVMGSDNAENASNIVGDVNVEVKITRDGRLRLKAFNKSNDRDYLNNNAPYTQGVGISYFTEFDNLKELFSRNLGKQKK